LAGDGRVGVEGEHREQAVDRRLGAAVAVDDAVAGDAVVGAAGARVVRRFTGAVGAEVPGGDEGGELAQAGAIAGRGDAEQGLQAGVDAVRDLRTVDRRGQPAVVRAAGRQQQRGEACSVAERRGE
jgi:hypothetical protein